MVEFRPARPVDAALPLRAADLLELQAVHGAGCDVQRILLRALAMTPDALAAVADGEVIALLGCAAGGTLMTPRGAPWLLGSDACRRHGRVFIQAGRAAVAQWLERFGALENWTDVRHVESHRWLRRLGFTLHPAQPYGVQGLPFHRFTRSVHL